MAARSSSAPCGKPPATSNQLPSPVYGENKVIIQYRVRDPLWPSRRPAGALRRRDPSHERCSASSCAQTLPLTPSISFVSTACASRSSTPSSRQCAPDRFLHLPFLDVQHEVSGAATAGNQHSIDASGSSTATTSSASFTLTTSSSRPASSARDCFKVSAVAHPRLVWNSFGSWLRTIRPGIPPSELVVAITLRQSLPEFLWNAPKAPSSMKFTTERQDTNKMQAFRLAA